MIITEQQQSLDGTWQIEIADTTGTIEVPGVWEVQGYPLDAESAIYRRTFTVPDDWCGHQIVLAFGAVSYHVDVVLNGQKVGAHTGLWTPFEIDITDSVNYGADNQIELHIVKPTDGDEGIYSFRHVLVGFIPYVSVTFGGVWQSVQLIARQHPPCEVIVHADWQTGEVQVSGQLPGNAPDTILNARILDADQTIVAELSIPITDRDISVALRVGNPRLWHPSDPYRYQLIVIITRDDKQLTSTAKSFGFRGLTTQDEKLLFNGDPTHLRGILHWGWYPNRLSPTPSDDEVRAEFQQMRDLGFNLIKLCLFVPSPNVFEIADEMGMFLWLELPLWWQVMNDHLGQQAPREYADMIRMVHHHPSVVLISLGCELSSTMTTDDLLARLDTIVRNGITGALICDNSGSAEAYGGHNEDLADFYDYHFYCDLQYFKPLIDHFDRDWRPARPWIFGEFCAYDDYRDPTPLIDADGQRPWWRDVYGVSGGIHRWAYSEQEKRMAELDLPFDHATLAAISRRQSIAMRRHIIEQTRLKRQVAGYVITGLRDTPINSSGILDDQLNFKFDADRWRQINSDSFIALESGRARIWHDGDQPDPIDRWNYRSGDEVNLYLVFSAGEKPLPADRILQWYIEDARGQRRFNGDSRLPAGLQPYQAKVATGVNFPVPSVDQPEQWRLVASVDDVAANEWPLWIYPDAVTWSDNVRRFDPAGALPGLQQLPYQQPKANYDGVLIASVWTEELAEWVRAGGRCICLIAADGGLPTRSVGFWQESLHLLYDHPILKYFPHEGHADLQFYHLAGQYALDTDRLKSIMPDIHAINPIMRRLHTRLFGITDPLIELRVGKGIIIASTLQFEGKLGDQVNGLRTNVAGSYLLDAMVRYVFHAT